jgi:dihydrolipoamide dehydrogenase
MDKFDLIVIGSGAGARIASQASRAGWKVALIDQWPTGGTCLNNGCIPSKMLIYPADAIRAIKDAQGVGVLASIDKIDFQNIMSRMHEVIGKTRSKMEESLRSKENLTYYQERTEFIGDYRLKAGEKTLTAPKIVIASGARSIVPTMPGLKEVGFLDNISLLTLKEPPKKLIIIGAGYLGCEYGHFFSAMGTDVTIIGRSHRVLDNEDPEVCRILKEVLAGYLKLVTSHEAVRVEQKGENKVVFARSLEDGKISEFEADEILLAVGRRSNSDLLHPELSGVELDNHGWIKVNEYLETSKKNIWAVGDAIGKHMFRHTANHESKIVLHNLLQAKSKDERKTADFHAVPHAVFTYPHVAAVGLKESDAIEAGLKILVGRAKYQDAAMGVAMADEHGFMKVVLEENGKILGASVIGPMAEELVQQVVYLMNTEHQDLMPVIESQVIHPTINEVLVQAFSELEHPII